MRLFGSPSSTIAISAVLRLLLLLAAIACFPSVAAEITIEELYTKISPTASLPGFNVEGGSVFENFANTLNHEQFFFVYTGNVVFESPESEPVRFSILSWCSDLTSSDVNNSSLIGYAARCVMMFLTGYADILASGAQPSYDYLEGEFAFTSGISAVFVEQLNVFEGQLHSDTDDWVYRYWDDGRTTTPMLVWEGHDEGDMSPNAATSSVSGFGEMTWMSVDEVAQLFNTTVDEFTPEKFKQVHLKTWIKDHVEEAATANPNPDAELAIIEQVKNETNYVDETTAPAEPDSSEDDGGIDAANPVGDDPSGSGRKLASVASRFVSAALRIFGI